MKKLLFLLVTGAVLASALFFGCSFFEPPDIGEGDPSKIAGSINPERKDVLALKHLQIPHVGEDTLASYVMDFLNAGTDAGRSALPSQAALSHAVAITKTTRLTHEVETGFAETTSDKRYARSVVGPGQIPFYVFTLEDRQTGKTGFALTCGDSRIGEVLAVVEEGDYDDDNPFLGIFYAGLGIYIENSIAIYNSITQADIENALNKISMARFTVHDVPVTDVGKSDDGFYIVDGMNSGVLLKTKWHQHYKNIVNEVFSPPEKYEYITGCVPTAIAQIMAYHGEKMIIAGKPAPYSQTPRYGHIKYNWDEMINGNDDYAIGVLMYEIGWYVDAKYTFGPIDKNDNPKKKDGASTSAFSGDSKIAYINMGYKDPGKTQNYNFSSVVSSINNYWPIQASGKTKIEYYILGIPVYGGGHAWVIDGYRRMAVKVKNKWTGEEIEDYPRNYVHCNLGWRYSNHTPGACNGWYISGVFNTNNIPLKDENDNKLPRSAGEDGYYQYDVKILTGIRP